MQGCVGLRDAFKALKYISEATHMRSRAADLKAAQQLLQHLLLAGRSRLAVPTVSHKRKHDACIAEIRDCVNDNSCINEVQLYSRPQHCSTAYLC